MHGSLPGFHFEVHCIKKMIEFKVDQKTSFRDKISSFTKETRITEYIKIGNKITACDI